MADPKAVALRGGISPKKGSSGGAKALPGAGSDTAPGVVSGSEVLAAGVARASGERAKRRRTPLLTSPLDVAIVPLSTLDASDLNGDLSFVSDLNGFSDLIGDLNGVSGVSAVDNGAIRAHRPRPVPKSGPALTEKTARRSETRQPGEPRETQRSAFSALPGAASPRTRPPSQRSAKRATPPGGTPAPARAGSGVDDLVKFAVATLRGAAAAAGLSGDDIERQVAGTLAFLRRRLNGDYTVDAFGFDEDFTKNAYLPLLRPLYRSWFRVEVRGIENIPSSGGALIVANHSGTVALDSLMTQVAVHDEHPAHRHLRMLGADLVFRTPVVGEVARKSGCTLAANPDAERLLATGELAGVFPEGFKGVGKPFSERYKLQRFGRGGFVAAALRTGVPIVPCSIVGAEEIYPIIGNLKTVARLIGAPYVPVTPTFPLLGPLGLIPLPSKWIIEFGSPVDTSVLGSQAADDPMVVFDLTDRVRETIQQTLYSLLLQRRSVFF